jgi:hypothetical protein
LHKRPFFKSAHSPTSQLHHPRGNIHKSVGVSKGVKSNREKLKEIRLKKIYLCEVENDQTPFYLLSYYRIGSPFLNYKYKKKWSCTIH